MKQYLSITIGRNIGTQPMSERAWDSFKSVLSKAVNRFCTVEGVVFDGEGAGVWAGQSEDAYTLALIVSEYQAELLRQYLKALGSRYNQDAVAFVAVPLPQGDETLIDCTE